MWRVRWDCARLRQFMVRDGYRFLAPPLALGIVAAVLGLIGTSIALLALAAAVAYFFRDPERQPPADPAVVVSPADGRVMEVVAESWDGQAGRRISIFLAVWNVHVSRAPMSGRLERLEYRPGKFYAAMRSRASLENEQNVFYLDTERGRIVFKQIAGWIARRVVSWKSPGDSLALGERIGLIRFGSRMDVWLPEGADVVARPGQKVAAGESVVARWP
jgi:phosphatidylserine decarboxylase